jgi:hypothetical protein
MDATVQSDGNDVWLNGCNRGGRRLVSGVYFVRPGEGKAEEVRKAVLVKFLFDPLLCSDAPSISILLLHMTILWLFKKTTGACK